MAGSLVAETPSAPDRRRRRVGWAVLAGAVVVVAGVAVAIPLWPGGGDAATTSKAGPAAALPLTPAPAPPVPPTPTPQLNGVRSGVPKPVKPKHTKTPAQGCRDYQRAYPMAGAGAVLLRVSVCRGAFSGTAVLADSAPKDGWDVCVQLRGHLSGPGPATYVSTLPLASGKGRVQSFENGPKARLGATTTRTEDSVIVNAGKCKGSGTRVQTAWQTQDRLATG